jgi:DNA-binding transcriptional LysR family regulator
MILNMNQLRVFYTVATMGSMTLAAEALMVTPQAVSKQLKVLEDFLEVKLLYSEGRTIKLTSIGSEMYEMSKEVFDRVGEIEKYIEDLSSLKAGVLRVGYSPTTAKYIMPQVIGLFKKDYPEIKIIQQQGFPKEMIKDVLDRKIEIAVIGRVPDIQREKLNFKAFKHRPLTLIASPKYPIADEIPVNTLATTPIFMPPEGSSTRAAVSEYFNKYKLAPNVVFESPNVDIEKELVRQGKGLCFVPDVTVREELKNETFKSIRIMEGHPEVRRVIIYPKGKSLSPAAQAFLRVLDKLDEIDPP